MAAFAIERTPEMNSKPPSDEGEQPIPWLDPTDMRGAIVAAVIGSVIVAMVMWIVFG
jgi:hypothetical protein